MKRIDTEILVIGGGATVLFDGPQRLLRILIAQDLLHQTHRRFFLSFLPTPVLRLGIPCGRLTGSTVGQPQSRQPSLFAVSGWLRADSFPGLRLVDGLGIKVIALTLRSFSRQVRRAEYPAAYYDLC